MHLHSAGLVYAARAKESCARGNVELRHCGRTVRNEPGRCARDSLDTTLPRCAEAADSGAREGYEVTDLELIGHHEGRDEEQPGLFALRCASLPHDQLQNGLFSPGRQPLSYSVLEITCALMILHAHNK